MQCVLHCNKTLILHYLISARARSINPYFLFTRAACKMPAASCNKTLYFTACTLRCTCKLTLAINPCFYTYVLRTKTLHASINLLYSTARFALYRTAALSMKLYFSVRLRRAATRSIKPCMRTSASL